MEVSYFFNSDFEDFLATEKTDYQIISTKRNQELEYFILWLENKPLYTTKTYAKDYLDFIISVKQEDVLLTKDKTHTTLWCQSLDEPDKQKQLNSKLTSCEFAIKEDLAHAKTQIVTCSTQINPESIYKDPLGVSGIGIWKGNEHQEKISTLMAQRNLISEPLLERTFDMSTCVLEGEDFLYQNHIDEQFQYKGATLGLKFSSVSWYDQYQKDVGKIKKYYNELGIKPPYSIDSFIYKEDGIEKLYSLSEVNARKSMGYIAIMLWKKYFNKFRYCSFKMINSKKILNKVDYKKIYDAFGGKVIPLSPYGNIFFTYVIAEDSLHDLYEVEDELLSTLFKSI